MKYAAVPRREIGIRTIFNILGPLTNPASASSQLLGVYDPNLVEIMAEVLGILGVDSALVVHGAGGLDELSLSGTNSVTRLRGGKLDSFYVDPRDLGLPLSQSEEIRGGSPEENAAMMKAVLGGERGPVRDTVLLNAAAGLVAAGRAGSFEEGLGLAAESIEGGAAQGKLDALVSLTRCMVEQ